MTNRSRKIRTPEQIARAKLRRLSRRANGDQLGVPAQMDHASSSSAIKKRRQGQQRMERQRGDK